MLFSFLYVFSKLILWDTTWINLERKTSTHRTCLAQPKSKFKPRAKQNPKSHQGFGRGIGRGTGRGTKVIGFDTLRRHAPREQRRRERRKKRKKKKRRKIREKRQETREREREREKRQREREREREKREKRDRETEKWERKEREREKWDNYMLPSEVSAKLVLDQSGLSSQTWTGFQWLYPPAFWTKDTLQRSMHHKIKNIWESNKDLCANALRRKNRTHWICEEWSVLSTCEWHTGMRQLDAPRHNLGHSPSINGCCDMDPETWVLQRIHEIQRCWDMSPKMWIL